MAIAAMIPMITTTITNSIRLNARFRFLAMLNMLALLERFGPRTTCAAALRQHGYRPSPPIG
jgi:hypothetical protein